VLGILLLGRSALAGVYPLPKHRLAVGILLFLAAALFAQTSAVRPDVGWEWLDYLTRLLLVCFLLVRLVRTRRDMTIAVGVIALSMGFHTSKAGLAYLLGGGVRFADGLSGAYIDNNGYALAAVMILPLLVATAQNIALVSPRFKKYRWTLFLLPPLTALLVIGTYSRAGLLGLAAVGAVWTMFNLRHVRVLVATLLLAAIVLLVVPIPDSYRARMSTIVTYQDVGDESAISRLYFWQVAWNMWEDNPFGVGLRNFNYAFDRYDKSGARYGHGRSVHNSHLQVLAETGIVGMLAWIALFASSLRLCWSIRKWGLQHRASHGEFYVTMSSAFIASMVGYLVAGTFIALALNDLTWYTFALVMALDGLQRAEASELPSQAEMPRQDFVMPVVVRPPKPPIAAASGGSDRAIL
jgi:probable O-glycosylation ligase (exosortase A-associated)